MVRLICVDVDGTLVGSSGMVLPDVWTAAWQACDCGVRLAVCSGRPAFGLARGYAERLSPDGWHIFQNGASLVHVSSGESRSRGLAPQAMQQLIERAHRTGRILELYTDDAYAVESTAERAQRHAGLLGVPFQVRTFGSLSGRVVRAQWLLAHSEVNAVLAEPHHGLTFSHSLSPVMPDTAFINITPEGVDKVSAVRELADALDVPLECVMMVGDGYNDLGVMKIVGHSVAMGNSEPEVLEVARYKVAHVDQGGLVEALALAQSLS